MASSTSSSGAVEPGVADLEALAATLRSLSLPERDAESLARVAEQAAPRMQNLEKGWEMCRKKRCMQSKYLEQISDLYQDDFHIVPVPMLGEEVRGTDALQAFARLLL